METIKYSLIGKQDIKHGRGTFEVTLGDGRVVQLDEINLDSFDKILSVEDSSASGTTNVLTLRHTTTGTPAAGLGVRVTLQGESGDENPSDLAAIEADFDDVTAGSEDSSFYIFLRTAGAALARRFGFSTTGAFLTTFSAAPTAARTITLPDATTTMVGTTATQTLTNKTLTNPTVNAGTGSQTFLPAGAINKETGSGATTAVVTEEDLLTYTMPANTLSATGKGVRITAAGTTASNTNTKTIRLYFGSTVVVSNDVTTAPNGAGWKLNALVLRNAAGTQEVIADGTVGSAPQTTTYTGTSEDPTGTITIKISGQNGVATANDITAQILLVEYLN